ncbi:MAG TPA: hypothetical protein VHG08_17270 [Longimicrobium sp.]|nr:hypothetical protein [Longimicrobium sp.]
MRRQWFGAALTAAALLLPAACARGATEPEAAPRAPAVPQLNGLPEVQTASGGYFGSGLRNDPPPDTTDND